jgi:hypothetical protein
VIENKSQQNIFSTKILLQFLYIGSYVLHHKFLKV